MLKRSTVISILLLAALVGLAVYLSRKDKGEKTDAEATPTQEIVYLFNESDGQPNRITIQGGNGQVVVVQQDSAGAWQFEKPVSAAAETGLVESATSQLITLRVLNTVTNLPDAAVGLDRPAFVITIQFGSSKEITFKVGSPTPTNSGYYVLKENGEMVIVGKAGVDSLLAIFNNPPESAAATPAATP